jgi:uncharacterized protein DUF3592
MFDLFIGALLAVAGLFGVAFSLRDMIRAAASLEWPSVAGVILESRVGRSPGKLSLTGKWDAIVRYRYKVGERDYSGDRIGFLWIDFSTPGRSERMVANYPVGASVKVRVNPRDPELAVLEAGVHWYAFVSIGALLAVIGSGLVLVWQYVR